MQKIGYVYILTNKMNTVLYVGVTNNIKRRLIEHRTSINKKSFTSKYNVFKLVYYETYPSMWEAIKREKQLKAGSRKKKTDLINNTNPNWENLM
jgi:putative endonuclease